jgi:hypothetical protein
VTCVAWVATRGLVLVICGWGVACQLRRPDIVPTRMIEPQLLEPVKQTRSGSGAVALRLLPTQARGHIGRRVLYQQPDGELTEDAVWRWSSAPDRYLDTALRLELTSSPEVRLVDAADAPALAVTLLAWHLESAGPRLVGAVELQFTGTDRAIRTEVVRASEPVSMTLPGDLAAVAGRLLRRLASESVTIVALHCPGRVTNAVGLCPARSIPEWLVR